jgi:hypothetical protein
LSFEKGAIEYVPASLLKAEQEKRKRLEVDLVDLRHQSRTWERLAREWNADYDNLKNRYEPMIATTTAALKEATEGGGERELP